MHSSVEAAARIRPEDGQVRLLLAEPVHQWGGRAEGGRVQQQKSCFTHVCKCRRRGERAFTKRMRCLHGSRCGATAKAVAES